MSSQQLWSIERVVVLVTPFFAAVASWLVALLANEVPGAPRLNAADVRDVMIAAFVGVVCLVLKWLHGRQIPALIQGPPETTLRPLRAASSPAETSATTSS